MATIGTQVFNDDGQKNYLALGNRDQYSRQITIPATGWQTMNIGVLFSIEATGTLPQGTGLWVGLTTSTQPGVGFKQGGQYAFFMQRMMGVGLGGGIGYVGTYTPGVWTYKSSSLDSAGSSVDSGGGYYFAISGSPGYQSSSGGNGSPALVPTAQVGDIPRKELLVCNINKRTGVAYDAGIVWIGTYTGSDGTNHNHTMETMLSFLCSPANAISYRTIDNVSQTYNGSATLPVQATDDTNYPLDTVNLYWTGSVQCRIYAVAVGIAR